MAEEVQPRQLLHLVFGGEVERLERRRRSLVHLHRLPAPDATARVSQP
jgi:hypothetical protein